MANTTSTTAVVAVVGEEMPTEAAGADAVTSSADMGRRKNRNRKPKRASAERSPPKNRIAVPNLGAFPKAISAVNEQLLLDGVVVFTNIECCGTLRSAIVELHAALLRDTAQATTLASDIARLLAYLYYVHSRGCGSAQSSVGQLTIVVDCRCQIVNDADVVRRSISLVDDALHALANWLPESLRRVYWLVDAPSSPPTSVTMEELADDLGQVFGTQPTESSGEENGEKEGEQNAEQQYALVDATQNKAHTKQWVEFRKILERLLLACNEVGALYVELYRSLKASSNLVIVESSVQELDDAVKSLTTAHESIASSEPYDIVMNGGEEMLRQITNDFTVLAHLPTYTKSLTRARGFYGEVRSIAEKAVGNVENRCQYLVMCKNSLMFEEKAKEVIVYCTTTALPRATTVASEPSASLVRLRLQSAQYEQFLKSARHRLDEGERLALETQGEYGEPISAEAESTSMQRVPHDLAARLHTVWMELVDTVERTGVEMARAREVLADRHVAHHMLDKVYDWSLGNATLSSKLAVLIERAVADDDSKKLDELMTSVQTQLSSYPTDELHQLPTYCRRLNDDAMLTQITSMAEKCTNALQSLRGHQRRLLQARHVHDTATREETVRTDGRVSASPSIADTEYEQPRSSTQAEPTICWRRAPITKTQPSARSSMSQLETLREHRLSYTLQSGEAERMANDDMPITRDMRDNVTSSMSQRTIQRRIGERHSTSTNNVLDMSTMSQARFDRKTRMGSARTMANKVVLPLRRLLRRSATYDQLPVKSKASVKSLPSATEVPSTTPATSSTTTTTITPHHRALSVHSLVSLPIEQASESSSVESPLDQQATSSSPSALTLQRRLHMTTLWSENNLAAHSRDVKDCSHLQHLAGPSNIRLPSPGPMASPDERMLFMTVDELLTTEVKYVQALHYVVKNYVAEMERSDLPDELKGQKYTIFGNVELILQFHAQTFLPQLQQRLANCDSEQLAYEMARCFVDHRQYWNLYAMFNKNKPKSDLLLNDCAAIFFKTKQLVLRDRLDLSAYLLQPVQRMGKYALFLGQLRKACPSSDAQDMLATAEDIVTFQLRHGNDCLAMDLITHCTLNLREQGCLLRQNDFLVTERRGLQRHRSYRRVFLFEKLIVLTKPRARKGSSSASLSAMSSTSLLADTFEYKHSLQMCDVGVTEVVEDSPDKFALWVRRHTNGQRLIFTAVSNAVRTAWLADVKTILWRQAIQDKEQRVAEQLMSAPRSSAVDLSSVSVESPPVARFVDCARPQSLVSLATSSSSCNSSSNGGATTTTQATRKSSANRHCNGKSVLSNESGICEDMALSMVPEEGIADQLHAKLHSILNDENSVDV